MIDPTFPVNPIFEGSLSGRSELDITSMRCLIEDENFHEWERHFPTSSNFRCDAAVAFEPSGLQLAGDGPPESTKTSFHLQKAIFHLVKVHLL